MDNNAELFTHILSDGLAESDDFLTCSPTPVDEHQRLSVVDTGTAECLSLPTTLFNHPTYRNLLMTGVNLEVWHIRILLSQFLASLFGDDGVHEETAGIALHLRVRQFGVTYLYDDVAQLLGRRFLDALTLQFCTDITVVEIRTESL